jgi:hypothetical protein
MDWKEDLGGFLASKHILRLEYLSEQLKVIADEWKSFVSKFDGIYINYDIVRNTENIRSAPGIKFSYNIHNRYYHNNKPFIIELNYFESESSSIALSIKYSTGYNFNRFLLEGILDYYFEENIYEEEEIFEPAYMLQTLNNILKIQIGKIEFH